MTKHDVGFSIGRTEEAAALQLQRVSGSCTGCAELSDDSELCTCFVRLDNSYSMMRVKTVELQLEGAAASLDAVQQQLVDETLAGAARAEPTILAQAERTNFKLDLATAVRYCSAAKWQDQVHGKPVWEYLVDTIRWRAAVMLTGRAPCPGAQRTLHHPAPSIERDLGPANAGQHDSVGAALDEQIYLATSCTCADEPIICICPGRAGTGVGLIETNALENRLMSCVETACSLCDNGAHASPTICVLVDCTLLSYATMPRVDDLKQVIGTLMRHYPCRLGRIAIVGGGVLLHGMWQVLATFLPAETKERVMLLSSASDLSQLHDTILPAELAAALRGNAKRAVCSVQCFVTSE